MKQHLTQRAASLLVLLLSTIGISCTSPSKKAAERKPQEATVAERLHYSFLKSKCKANPCLKVVLTFQGNDTGVSNIRLPSTAHGQKELYRAILNLRSTSDGAKLTATDISTYEIHYTPRQEVRLAYDVVQDFKGPLDTDENYYRAIVQENYFHFLGHTVLIHPEIEDEMSPIDITLDWAGFRGDERVANSFGADQRHQQIQTSLRKLNGAVYLGGDIRLKKFSIQDRPVWTALRGKFGFSDSSFQVLLKKILVAERSFWNDFDFPYFMVSAISISKQDHSHGGCGTTQGSSIFGDEKMKVDESLVHLLSHELFHTWNGRKIQRKDPEELVYWFSEGFTNYYARLLSLRSGLIDLGEYVRDYNDRAIRMYWMSSVRNEPVERVLKDFWNNSDVEKLPYQQGDILAHRWNDQIKTETRNRSSIDDFMKSFLKSALESGDVVSPETVDRLIRPYLSQGITADHDKFIIHGETIPLLPEHLGDCVSLTQKEFYRFDLGFDFKASKQTRTVTGVRQGGPADRAGLKDGQKLAGWGLNSGDTEHEAEFFLKTPTGTARIAFLPRGEAILVPQYVLDEGSYRKNPKRCLGYFSQKTTTRSSQ